MEGFRIREKKEELNEIFPERFNLAWILFENYKYDEVLRVDFEPKEEGKCEYYDLIGRAYLGLDDYKKGISKNKA